MGLDAFVLLDIGAKDTDLVIFMFLEIEAEFLAKPQLQQVIIQRLFGNPYLCRGLFKRVFDYSFRSTGS